MDQLVSLLKENKLTISCCESFTGGEFASQLCNVVGASKVFKGGIVAYSDIIKEKVVGVDLDILVEFGAVSGQTAAKMAEKTRALMQTDICIAFTGNAGPTSSDQNPVGLWYMAISTEIGTVVYKYLLDLKRNELRDWAVHIAAKELESTIRDIVNSGILNERGKHGN